MTDEVKRAYDWLESLASGKGFASYLIGAPEEARHAADMIERLSAENDALQKDLQKFASAFPLCEICAKGKFDVECTTWTDKNGREVCDFVWRGPCEENEGRYEP